MKSPAAFISYARRDDRAYSRRITGIRERLQGLVGAAIGRDFEIFQDCEGIAWGQHWRARLDEALEEALFLIPILTPSYFSSAACRAELETFLELERRSGRNDRILSLYFLTAPVYEEKADPLAATLQERQHRDWRHLRIDPLGSAKAMRALDSLAAELAAAIHARQAAVSPPATVPGAAAQTPAPETISPVPRESATTVPVPTSGRTRMGALNAGDLIRDLEAPWCPELVVIPAGSFVMGSPEDEAERSSREGPQRRVTFAKPFALGRYPVTFEEFDHFCIGTGREKPYDDGWGRGRWPAINVSWEDAQVYSAWLSGQTGQAYRLPSEAEWEYACRAGTTTPFWTGVTISTDQANYDGNDTYGPGRKGEYRRQTTPVDAFEANPWGLHDMHGNVREWVEDWWNDSYEGAPNNGSAWTSGDLRRRVLRGGYCSDVPSFLRSACRIGDYRWIRDLSFGFRVARTLATQPGTSAAKDTDSSKYHTSALAGRITFNYSNNNGRYSIGRDEFFFETVWSKAGDESIHLYSDPPSIAGIAEAPELQSYKDVVDAASYDMSSRVRTIQEGEHAIIKNIYDNYAVLKVVDVKDRTRADSVDELTFEFWILSDSI